MARPRVRYSPKMSAITPVISATGALANTPTSNLKTRKAGQFGASAQASVHIQNMTNVPMMSHRRPNCSDNGAQTSGPEEFVLSTGRPLEAQGRALFTEDVSW